MPKGVFIEAALAEPSQCAEVPRQHDEAWTRTGGDCGNQAGATTGGSGGGNGGNGGSGGRGEVIETSSCHLQAGPTGGSVMVLVTSLGAVALLRLRRRR